MANINVGELPVAISVTGDDYVPLDQGGVTKRAKASLIAGTATGFVPTTRQIDAGVGLSGGGTLASDVTLNFDPGSLFAATTMTSNDTFVIQQFASDIPRQIVFADAMKGIGTLPSSPALNLTADKFVVLRSADGETYSATASQISIAAGNVPAGGTTGQSLVKKSDADYDTEWSTGGFLPQPAGYFFGGPASGPNTVPAFRALVGTDLPNPGASSKGGVYSYAAVSNQFLTQIGTDGSVVSAQPSFSNISGTATVSQGGTGVTSTTAYALLAGGTTTTGPLQSLSGVGTSGQVLVSNGAAALPTWQTATSAIGQALTRVDDTNVTLTLGGAPTTALLSATSLTLGWTGQLALTRGGTAASLTASNGGIVYSTASAMAILSGTATAGQIIRSGSSAAPSWSTSTYPATSAAGTLLASLTANTITATSTPTLGIAGSTIGTLAFAGNTSGTVTVTPQAAAGTPTLTFPNASGTFAVSATAPITLNATTGDIGITSAALTRVDDTNVTLTLGGSPTTALLAATSLTLGWTGQLALTRGGTAASLTASNGGIVYSTASAMAILSGTATAGQILRSGSSAAPSWSTSTYPDTSSAGTILASGSANTITATATPTLGVQQTTQGQLILANTAAGAFPVTLQSSNSTSAAWTLTLPTTAGTSGFVLSTNGSGVTSWVSVGGTGTVTDVSFTGGLISVANSTTTPAFTVAGTSGGIPYFSSASTWASSAALAANAIVIGGGAGAAPATTTTGTGVVTALGQNVNGSGAIVLTTSPSLVTPAIGVATGTSLVLSAGAVATTFAPGYTTTATAAGTTTLTVASTEFQFFTGTTTQTVVLPVTSTLTTGFRFVVVNNSTGVVTVQSSGANNVLVMGPQSTASFVCILTSGTSAASWQVLTAYANIPQNSQSAAYTTVLSDAGKHILHPSSDNNARTFTIDSNANVPYPVGTAITFVNQINTVTIAITSDTLTFAGAGTTGSRTLAASGIATALKISSTSWIISGVGIT